MYTNMDEMRKVLSWLVGALPSTEEPVADHTGIAGQTLHSKGAVFCEHGRLGVHANEAFTALATVRGVSSGPSITYMAYS